MHLIQSYSSCVLCFMYAHIFVKALALAFLPTCQCHTARPPCTSQQPLSLRCAGLRACEHARQVGWTADDALAAEGLWDAGRAPQPGRRAALAGAGGALAARAPATDLGPGPLSAAGAAGRAGSASAAADERAASAVLAEAPGRAGAVPERPGDASGVAAEGALEQAGLQDGRHGPGAAGGAGAAGNGPASSQHGDSAASGSASMPPLLLVANKADLVAPPGGGRHGGPAAGPPPWPALPGGRAPAAAVRTSAATGEGLEELRGALLQAAGLAQVAPGARPRRAPDAQALGWTGEPAACAADAPRAAVCRVC
jgi:hypothetical protein